MTPRTLRLSVLATASWRDAASFVASLASGLGGRSVDAGTRAVRVRSCSSCPELRFDHGARHHYCGACRCGSSSLSRLDAPGATPGVLRVEPDGPRTKLDFPYLVCPLERPGFSNETVRP